MTSPPLLCVSLLWLWVCVCCVCMYVCACVCCCICVLFVSCLMCLGLACRLQSEVIAQGKPSCAAPPPNSRWSSAGSAASATPGHGR
jgi:hypothetical protein